MAVPLQHARLDAQAIAAAANAFAQPAAIVCNSHITGLAVARSLAKRGVPVIGLDREPNGVALASNALVAAGICANPIEHEEEFVLDLLAIGAELKQPAVLFGCMDEWVLAMNAHRERLEQFFLFPFADDATVRRILDKSELYREAAALGVPIPRSLDVLRGPFAIVERVRLAATAGDDPLADLGIGFSLIESFLSQERHDRLSLI